MILHLTDEQFERIMQQAKDTTKSLDAITEALHRLADKKDEDAE